MMLGKSRHPCRLTRCTEMKATWIILGGLGFLLWKSKNSSPGSSPAPAGVKPGTAVAPPGNSFVNLTPGILTNFVRGVLGGARSTTSSAAAPGGPGSGPGFNDALNAAGTLATALGTGGSTPLDPATNQVADAAIQDWQNQVAAYNANQSTVDPALLQSDSSPIGNLDGDPINALPAFTPAVPVFDPTSEGFDITSMSSPADPFSFDPTSLSAGGDFSGDLASTSDFTDASFVG